MQDIRTPPPGGGQLAKNHEIIANNLIQYQNIISQQANQLKNMEKICMELKNELDLLKTENQNLKKNITTPEKNDTNVQYETDEDELARETDWILKKRPSKKRKAEVSPEIQASNSKVTAKASFEQKEKKIPRPPPIMISGECDYQQILNIARKEMKKEFLIKLLNNNTYKINASDPDDYRNLTKMLTNKNLSWYTYENKQSRPIKVMVKNLHHTSDPGEVISYLQKQGFKAVSAVNKLKWKTKEPLDMFLLTFDSSENIKKIYEIKTILHSVITIEAVRQSKLIPQCKACQAYGHTQNYCGKQPRCVKCAGKHKTIECTKPEKQQPKCCNCGESHPASYRGCVVAKELQRIRDQRTGSKINILNSTQGKNTNKKPIESCRNNLTRKPMLQNNITSLKKPTFSQVVKGNNHSENANILQQILEKITTQNEYMTALEKRLQKLEKTLHLSE